MKILAVEFSSAQRSVAVVEAVDGADSRLLGRAAESGAHRALGLVEEALRQAQCQREEMEVLAIGLGPGSYTGIRGAIALAQGWQLGRGVHLIGRSSAEVLALGAAREKIPGPINIIIDAQRNEFYLARYEITPSGPREAAALRLASLAEIEDLSRHGETMIGPDATAWFPSARNLYPEAAMLGQLAAGQRDFVLGEKLEPIYLRETAFKKAKFESISKP